MDTAAFALTTRRSMTVNQPTVGEIVLFPSWVKHSVPPSIEMSDTEERITLAFNYQLKATMERSTQKWEI